MPKQVDHDKRRVAFAAAAYRVIARVGLSRVTVREIAKEAGFTTGALVHYFSSKDQVLIQASEYSALVVRERMERHAVKLHGMDALRHVLFESLPMTPEMRGMWNVWLGFWDRSSHSAKIKLLTKTRYEEWMGRIAHLIQDAQAAGELSGTIEPARAAQAVVAMIDGIGVRVLLTGITISPARQKEMVDDWLAQLPRPVATKALRARRKGAVNGAEAAAE
ncbi:MAG: TetR family transcriptional regulator [Alphaproteobacteria bacterium]|nr:TetR family transcriptional regulator [Alphaproteobacteria bacterium]